MFKTTFILIVLSLLAFLGMDYFIHFLNMITGFHHFVLAKITHLLPETGVTKLISNTLALLVIPIVVGFVPSFIYWLFTRREMPWITEVIWILWAILLTTIALHR